MEAHVHASQSRAFEREGSRVQDSKVKPCLARAHAQPVLSSCLVAAERWHGTCYLDAHLRSNCASREFVHKRCLPAARHENLVNGVHHGLHAPQQRTT